MRVATWNVNSLKARIERVELWLAEVQPDVVCMQETKCSDDGFPALSFGALGYEAVHHGEGRWNGVAILSRAGIDDVIMGFADGGDADDQARLVSATCGGVRVHSVYVPNGRAVGTEHYDYKLAWLERLLVHLERTTSPDQPVIVAGDFNVAPEDRDVWSPKAFEGATHVTTAERDAVRALEKWGLVDVFRRHFDDGGLFSWWDYRAGDFHEKRGMRIDLLLASAPLAERSAWALIDRNARKGKAPSDHAPLVVDFAL